MKGADAKTLRLFYPGVLAIKNCRTTPQAHAMKAIVLNHMRDMKFEETDRRFEEGALSERWFTWFNGYVGPGFTPSTNAQESWHRNVKGNAGIGPQHRSSDDLFETVFPMMLQKDGMLRCGAVTVQPPDVSPAEYVEQAI